jgi:hypothetical protein
MSALDQRARRGGYTATEILVASTIFLVAVTGTLALLILHQNSWYITTLTTQSSGKVGKALQDIVYGPGTNSGLRAAMLGSATNYYTTNGWLLVYNGNRFLRYRIDYSNIVDETGHVFCDNVISSTVSLTVKGCMIGITAVEQGGRHRSLSRMTTSVRFRN